MFSRSEAQPQQLLPTSKTLISESSVNLEVLGLVVASVADSVADHELSKRLLLLKVVVVVHIMVKKRGKNNLLIMSFLFYLIS